MRNKKVPDYYKLLQLDRESDNEAIENAYRGLARRYHPDRNKSSDAEEKMKQLNEARETLIDSEKRRRYDEILYQQEWQNEDEYKEPSQKQKTSFYEDEGERYRRAQANQFLSSIQSLLNENKWRIAQQNLYAFEGLGILSKDSQSPRFSSNFPEWHTAQKLSSVAEVQAKTYKTRMNVLGLFLYGGAGVLISFIVFIALLVMPLSSDEINTAFLIILGSFVGLPILGLIGVLIYSSFYAGKWGSFTDYALGTLSPIILATVVTFGIWLIGLIIVSWLIYTFSTSSNKK